MRILIRLRAGDGAPATERRLELERLRLGRGAEQDLVLNDLRVALAHAEIVQRKGLMGPVCRIELLGRLPLSINDSPSTGGDLAVGDEVDLGRYRLTVLKPPAGLDLALELEERYAVHDERRSRREALKQTPAEAGWSRRRLAWGLFLLVLLSALLLPLAMTMRSDGQDPLPVDRDRPRKAQPSADILWNSGPLSSAHHALQNDCQACHRKPFEPASDDSCRGCHAPLREHAGSHQALALPPFSTQRCTDCHREHNGMDGLVPAGNPACTVCHDRPVQGQGMELQAATDFSRSHPPFRLRLARREGDHFVWPAQRQGSPEAVRQDSGLKFPHDLHLSEKGIDAPGGRRRMDCGDCHQPTADRSGFLPVRMAEHCSDCHRLDFDPADPEHELPHGKPAQVVRMVRDYYAAQALTGRAPVPDDSALRRLPGARTPPPSAAPVGRTPAWAEARAEQALRDVFERRTCFYCHTVTRDGPVDSPWRIAPVAEQRLAFAASVFPHSAHATESCGSCHQAATSKKTEDVLLPDIQRCRDCHGDTGAMRETPSSCQSCHDYHRHDLVATKAPGNKPVAAP